MVEYLDNLKKTKIRVSKKRKEGGVLNCFVLKVALK